MSDSAKMTAQNDGWCDTTTSLPELKHVDLLLDASTEALLAEALRLTHEPDEGAVLRRALKELVERQRFLDWVARHDDRGSGTA